MQEQDNGNLAAELTRRLAEPMYQGKIWLQIVGVLIILYGAMIALSIVGIVIAWLPIWMGVLLFQSAGAFEQAFDSGDEQAMLRAQQKLKTYFTIMGVLTLIGLIIGGIFFVAGIGMGIMGGMSSMGGM